MRVMKKTLSFRVLIRKNVTQLKILFFNYVYIFEYKTRLCTWRYLDGMIKYVTVNLCYLTSDDHVTFSVHNSSERFVNE